MNSKLQYVRCKGCGKKSSINTDVGKCLYCMSKNIMPIQNASTRRTKPPKRKALRLM